MNIDQIIGELQSFKRKSTEQSWKRESMLRYENEYIQLLRIDSSNKSGGSSVKNGKQWSIIFKLKKSFTHLMNWRLLLERMEGEMAITPVTRGVLADNYAIRIYGMANNPEESIVRNLLDFIFDSI